MDNETFCRGQHFRILPGAVWGVSPVATNFNIGDVVKLTRDGVDGDGDLYGVNQHGIYGYVNTRYAVEVDVEVVDAVQEPQDIFARIATLRAELAALEAQQEAKEREVEQRALRMRSLMNEAQGAHNGLAWHTVKRGYMALARAYKPID